MVKNIPFNFLDVYNTMVEILEGDFKRINHDLLKQYIHRRIGVSMSVSRDPRAIKKASGDYTIITYNTLKKWASSFSSQYMDNK